MHLFEDDDLQLVRRVQAGEIVAFEALVRRHHLRVYRTLIGICGRSDDAEDDVQTVFLRAFEHIGSFRGAARLSTWLTRIAMNVGLERVRARRRRRQESHLPPVAEDEGDSYRPANLLLWSDDAELLYSRNEVRELVERAIMSLPAKYRAVVLLRDIEQLSTEEAAAALGLNTATLKTRLLRGRLRLRDALAPHFVDRARTQDASPL
ncbi:MAG TPA: sigma-70 family RNA polymerase sigma factor [Candidatus Polarisedimenticolaceae bacterium]|nr:sigma-70 family RNA polymerase sigma factor [Candidatus Polarisedimenticolaceae bacterium]